MKFKNLQDETEVRRILRRVQRRAAVNRDESERLVLGEAAQLLRMAARKLRFASTLTTLRLKNKS